MNKAEATARAMEMAALAATEEAEAAAMKAFEKDLAELINRHAIENVVDMPDFILAEMICSMIAAMGPSIKKTLDWYGCNSVCHPAPELGG